MTTRTEYRGVRRAASILLLAAGGMAFGSFANPVLLQDGEESSGARAADERSPDFTLRPERRAEADNPSTPPLPVVIDEIRIDESAPGRRPGWDGTPLTRLGATPGLPGSYGGVFGQGDTLREQLLRDFGSAGTYPGGGQAAGLDQLRRGSAQDLANPTQAMLREGVDNALKLIRESVVDEIDMAGFSVIGVEFNLMLSGSRPLLVANTEYWSTMPQVQVYDEVRPEASGRTSVPAHAQGSASTGAGAHSLENPQGVAPDHPAPLLVQKIREFITDATTIVVALACLILWLTYEMTSSIRERRRLRRARRRRARARG